MVKYHQCEVQNNIIQDYILPGLILMTLAKQFQGYEGFYWLGSSVKLEATQVSLMSLDFHMTFPQHNFCVRISRKWKIPDGQQKQPQCSLIHGDTAEEAKEPELLYEFWESFLSSLINDKMTCVILSCSTPK